MLDTYEILDTTRIRVGDTDCWQIRQRRPDGGHHLTVFPTSALEWRAAEYGIDHTTPDGLEQIIDMVLHEPFIPDPLLHRDQDPAAAKGHTAASTQAIHGLSLGDEAPVTLFNAPSRAHARRAHQLRIEHTKRTRIKVVTPPAATTRTGTGHTAPAAAPSDPLHQLRTEHGITAHGVAAKHSTVQQVRADLAARLAEATGQSGPAAVFPQQPAGGTWDASLAARDQAHQEGSQ
ncbi:hypothetical protein LN042_18955 [Kitasatospora sp. RB6PN24]|uniref:hypothetical protein n=1 Tax=Kitasatospora humi TaxID=2893891 RepID=UPI001E3A6233|nr:hypothetical protein [Kitasatospora humi]MCC9309136.1 hypothetical protein [Kitasatospora humi]